MKESRFVIYDRNDGHIVDTAETPKELRSKSWWRPTHHGIASRSWFTNYGLPAIENARGLR